MAIESHISAITSEVLAATFGKWGFVSADVSAGMDDLGEAALSFLMKQIGGNFAGRQNSRHTADYRPASADPISYERAEALIEMAQQTRVAIDLRGDDLRLAVAVLLISRPRSN